MSRRASLRARPVPALLALPLLLASLLPATSSCGPEQVSAEVGWETVDVAEVWRVGSRGVALCEQHEFAAAADEWRRVVELAPFWYTARINLGIALLNDTSAAAEARAVFEEVAAEFPGTPWANYCLGILDEQEAKLESAERRYRAVLRADPRDPDTHLRLGLVLTALDRAEEATEILRRAVQGNPNLLTGWFALASAARETGDEEAHAEAMERFRALQEGSGGEERAIVFGRMGFYAAPLRPEVWDAPRPPEGPAPEAYAVVLADGSADAGLDDPALAHGGPGSGFFSSWLTNASRSTEYAAEASGGVAAVDWDVDGDTDLLAAHWGEGPDVRALENDGSGRFADRAAELGLDGEGPARTIAVASADFDGDGLPDLFLGRDGADRIVARDDATSPFARPITNVAGPEEPTLSLAMGDIDLDGDLDLMVGRHSGVAYYRWTGVRFEDATQDVGGVNEDTTFAVVLADVDGDHDVDAISGTPIRLRLNERLWKLRQTAGKEFGVRARAASFTVGDLDGDGLSDWLLSNPAEPTRLLRAQPGGVLTEDEGLTRAGIEPAFSSFLVDVDRDGDLDVWTVGETPGMFLQEDDGSWSSWTDESGLAALAPKLANVRGSVLLDADGDGDLDLFAVRNGETPLLIRNDTDTGPLADWIGVLPRGIEDRARARGRALGPGAEVEVVAAGRTRRAWSGVGGGFASVAPETLHFTLAGSERTDVRIRWSDQVLQTEIDLPGGQVHEIEQVDREASSCPIAFYWNGEEFVYRADFLGSGGLGFLVAPGVYGQPDPREVLLLGDDLAPLDGALEVRVTEPMEEVSYIDRVELLRVQHAPGTRAIPEERFATDGRLASGRVLVVRDGERVFPTGARVVELESHDPRRHVRDTPDLRGAGDDELAERIASVDRRYVGPPALNRRLLGYAAEWAVELSFPADARLLAEPERVHLLAHGWVEYPYSRLNYAASQSGLAGEPPSLDVPDGAGGWRTVRPHFGYMGGKSRTMALPLGEHLAAARDGEHLRFRLRTNLPVYLDQVLLAIDRADTDLVAVERFDPSSAEVRFAGFPRVHSPDGARPDVHDYSELDVHSDFKVLPGRYTELGDALDLVRASDDRFAIFARGEELALRFDEPGPPAAGAHITWMLDARGYCKDMCPLSSNPDRVEPLPYGSMDNYPPDEPLGAAHPSARSPRNTRVVEPAAPPRRP